MRHLDDRILARAHKAVPLRKRTLAAAIAVAALALPAHDADAANCNWLPASGNWGSSGDWSCGIVPTGPGNDTANVPLGATVTVDSARSIAHLNNAGQVNIDAFLLTLQAGGSSSNSGTVMVGGPSTAALQMSHSLNNTDGAIVIGNGSVLNHLAGTLTGGTVSSTGSGAVVAFSNAGNFLSGVTLNGTLDMSSTVNARERVINGLTLNGAVNLANGGILSLDGAATAGGNQLIGGNGVINLNDAGARLAVEGSGSTTLASGITVRGQGNIGQALFNTGNNLLVNQGLISADVDGGTLEITRPANGGGSSIDNAGTLQAINGGVLRLSTDVNALSGSQVFIGAGSQVVQNGVTLTGEINAGGDGLLTAVSSGANFLDGVTLNGTLDLGAFVNGRERIINGLTLNGAIDIANGGVLSLDSAATPGGNQTVDGSGVINLNDAGARLAVEGSGSTTLASGITVRGQGNIGQALFTTGNNVLVNQGTISADVDGGTLEITRPGNGGGSRVDNAGTLQAINGGVLRLSTNVNALVGSQVFIGAGSQVVQNGVTLTGEINAGGDGLLTAVSSGANFLDGVTLNGVLDLSAILNSRERVINGLTFNGAIDIGNGGILSLDSAATPGGNQTIDGNGVINLNDAGARLAVEGSGITTLASGITVRGQGNIGQALLTIGNNALVNAGRIVADVDGATLSISNPASGGGSSLTNHGVLEARDGATLAVATALTNAADGRIQVGADALFRLQTAAFTNQGLVQGDGTVQTLTPATALVNGGTLAPGINGIGTLSVVGGYSQGASGALELDITNLASVDLLDVSGAASLNGALNLHCLGACSFAVGEEFTVLDAAAGALSGSFASVALFGFGSGAFDVLYDLPNGDVRLRVTEAVSAVPLPAPAWLLLGGLGVLLGRRRAA